MHNQSPTNRAIESAPFTRDEGSILSDPVAFLTPIFPAIGARFTAPDGQIWKVATAPSFQPVLPGMVYATRGGGCPGFGYFEGRFHQSACLPANRGAANV